MFILLAVVSASATNGPYNSGNRESSYAVSQEVCKLHTSTQRHEVLQPFYKHPYK